MGDNLFAITLSLFLLMDPIGNIPIYLTILSEIDLKKRQKIILREKLFALFIILIFAIFGNEFLAILHISSQAIFLSGGIILFLMALKMIFPERGSLLNSLDIEGEPLIFPLAIPLVAGPAVLAAVMIYSAELTSQGSLFLAIALAWLASTIILIFSTYLQRWLGIRGIKALERLMGLILILIATNMLLEGYHRL